MLLLYIFVSLLARWRFQLAILDGCKIKFHEKVFIAYTMILRLRITEVLIRYLFLQKSLRHYGINY